MGRRNYLGAMTQARHCVTLRWPLPDVCTLIPWHGAWQSDITVCKLFLISKLRTSCCINCLYLYEPVMLNTVGLPCLH